MFCWGSLPSAVGLKVARCFPQQEAQPCHCAKSALSPLSCHRDSTELPQDPSSPHPHLVHKMGCVAFIWRTPWVVFCKEREEGRAWRAAVACMGTELCLLLLSPLSPLPPPACWPPSPSRGVFLCPHPSSGAGLFAGLCQTGGCKPQPRSGVCRGARLPLGSPDGESHISLRTT